MGNRNEGLKAKYCVERWDGKPLKRGAIVLEFGDPNCWPAIQQFADTVRDDGYELLASDIEIELSAAKSEKED